MKNYDLIALDMDGTLCDDNKVIPQENITAIIEMQKMGKTVAVATGRPESGILPYIKALELEKYGGYVLSYNGGRIFDVKNNKVLHNVLFDKKFTEMIMDDVKGSTITVTSPLDTKVVAGNALNPYSKIEANVVGLPFFFHEDFLSLDIPMNKLLLIDCPESISHWYHILKEKYEPQVNVFLSEAIFMEITPSGINKGSGLKALAQITGIPTKRMIAMGDSFNDIEMLQTAGLGVAMANSKPGVGEYADEITLSNNECGVAEIIRKYVLNM